MPHGLQSFAWYVACLPDWAGCLDRGERRVLVRSPAASLANHYRDPHMIGTPIRLAALVSMLGWTLVRLLFVPQVAHVAVVITRAQVRSGRLRLEGIAMQSRSITIGGMALGTSDSSRDFRI